MSVITLTLNPAFDIHCFTETFKPFCENLASVTSRDAGGKGINISRALASIGCDSLALVTLGEENRGDFEKALEDACVRYKAVTVSGRIRENITLHTASSAETRISFAGFSADDGLIDEYEKITKDYTEQSERQLKQFLETLDLKSELREIKKNMTKWNMHFMK